MPLSAFKLGNPCCSDHQLETSAVGLSYSRFGSSQPYPLAQFHGGTADKTLWVEHARLAKTAMLWQHATMVSQSPVSAILMIRPNILITSQSQSASKASQQIPKLW